jgi:hypothetical protein
MKKKDALHPMKMLSIRLTLFVIFPLSIVPLNFVAGQPQTPASKNEINVLIESSQPDVRKVAINSILTLMNSDTSWAVEIMLRGLHFEDNFLSYTKDKSEKSVMIGWENIQKLVRDLAQIAESSPELLKNIIPSLSHDKKIWAKISLGYQKDESVHEYIKNLILNFDSGSLFQRAMAIESIASYKNDADISVFLAVVDTIDNKNALVPFKSYSHQTGFYPTRNVALRQLWKLGFRSEFDSTGNVIFKRKNN